jgi:leucyl/phenylalanyl-tRNA---protein transferase
MTHADANLSPEALVRAYAHGYFPMADSRFGRVRWYTAEARAILPLESFHVPRRLRHDVAVANPADNLSLH